LKMWTKDFVHTKVRSTLKQMQDEKEADLQACINVRRQHDEKKAECEAKIGSALMAWKQKMSEAMMVGFDELKASETDLKARLSLAQKELSEAEALYRAASLVFEQEVEAQKLDDNIYSPVYNALRDRIVTPYRNDMEKKEALLRTSKKELKDHWASFEEKKDYLNDYLTGIPRDMVLLCLMTEDIRNGTEFWLRERQLSSWHDEPLREVEKREADRILQTIARAQEWARPVTLPHIEVESASAVSESA